MSVPTVEENRENDQLRELLAEINIPTSDLVKQLKELQERMAIARIEAIIKNNNIYENNYVQRQKTQKQKDNDYCL